MKKTSLLIMFAIIASLTTSAQFTAAEYLDINNVRARYMVHGDMFWNPTTGIAAYEFPKGSGKHSNFASSIWIGGIDQSTNNLKVAAQTYRQTGNDYWPGPIDQFNGSSIDSLTCANWAQIWKVNRTAIDSFLSNVVHTLSNTPPSILEWPGRKNMYSKTPSNTNLVVPDRDMAPFVDVNSDNVYNPLDGDYPDIKGEQMLWWIFNDKAFAKTNSGSDAIDLEIQASAYACNKPGLKNTTFVNLRVYNWGSSTLDSTFLGIWNDADLGYGFDDYIGFDGSYSMAVTYNGDGFDETSTGYGSSLTQTGLILTRGPRVINPDYPSNSSNPYLELKPSIYNYFDNSQDPKTGTPSNALEFYNYLSGSWRDGSPIMAGCNPAATTGIPTKIVFPDDPSIIGGTSEVSCNRAPSDRRTLISAGPFQLYPGIVPSDITFAFINTDTGVNNSNFNELRRLADSAYQYANGCSDPITPLSLTNIGASNLLVYPNPAEGYFVIEDETNSAKEISLYNSYGQKVFNTKSKNVKTQVNVSDYAKGVYFLRIEVADNQYSQSLLVK